MLFRSFSSAFEFNIGNCKIIELSEDEKTILLQTIVSYQYRVLVEGLPEIARQNREDKGITTFSNYTKQFNYSWRKR